MVEGLIEIYNSGWEGQRGCSDDFLRYVVEARADIWLWYCDDDIGLR